MTLDALTQLLTAAGVFLGGAATLNGQRRIRDRVGDVASKVNDVHDEVKTVNGLTLGDLADRAEGRRSEAVDAADRTRSEKHYVENLGDALHDDANEPPPPKG